MAVVSIQSLRGMYDILPEHIHQWQWLEQTIRELMHHFEYKEIRFPIMESTDLFKRSLGDTTDIVGKEMYTFTDRNGDSVTLRPEGTASCVRAVIQHGRLHDLPQRLWYTGTMFRHERPQQGRHRQFYQFGVEVFGFAHPVIEVEIINLAAKLWDALKIRDRVHLQINTLGTPEIRARYKNELVHYLTPFHDQLDVDSQHRLHHNPLRILDSKNPETQKILENAPQLRDMLDAESEQHFSSVCKMLQDLHIPFTVNPKLVRGLDYYTHTVFEWVADGLGAQSTVCAGGRYDGLVEQLGGKPTPAVGFAIGIDRLIGMGFDTGYSDDYGRPHVYVIAEENYLSDALVLSEKIRQKINKIRILNDYSGSSLKSQFKKADKNHAKYAIILGAREIQEGQYSVKALETGEQQSLHFDELINYLRNSLWPT